LIRGRELTAAENPHMVADQALDIQALKAVVAKKW
jgi:hypothetical protein